MSEEHKAQLLKWVQVFLPAAIAAISTVVTIQVKMSSMEKSLDDLKVSQGEISVQVSVLGEDRVRYEERMSSMNDKVEDLKTRTDILDIRLDKIDVEIKARALADGRR